jgi:5-formyltetrahydrofolate cyclo-ligase
VQGLLLRPLSPVEARRRGLKARRQLAACERNYQSRRIQTRLIHYLLQTHHQCIALYLSTRDEVRLDALIRVLEQRRRQVLLPVVISDSRIGWLPTGRRAFVRRSHFAIREPHRERRFGSRLAHAPIDCIVVPMSAFDAQCHRTGMGGGYYDRELARLRHHTPPVCIGVAFDEQRTELIAVQPWDETLDAVITANQTFIAQDLNAVLKKTLKPLQYKGKSTSRHCTKS